MYTTTFHATPVGTDEEPARAFHDLEMAIAYAETAVARYRKSYDVWRVFNGQYTHVALVARIPAPVAVAA